MKIDQFLEKYDLFDAGVESYKDNGCGIVEIISNFVSGNNEFIRNEEDTLQNYKITIKYKEIIYDDDSVKAVNKSQFGNMLCFEQKEEGFLEIVASVTDYKSNKNLVLSNKIKVASINIERSEQDA
jgi:hypothetical protein